MEIDKWVGSCKIRALPWIDRESLYCNVQYFAPGSSLERPPAWEKTIFVKDDAAGRRLVFEFTDTFVNYIIQNIPVTSSNKKIYITVGGNDYAEQNHRNGKTDP